MANVTFVFSLLFLFYIFREKKMNLEHENTPTTTPQDKSPDALQELELLLENSLTDSAQQEVVTLSHQFF